MNNNKHERRVKGLTKQKRRINILGGVKIIGQKWVHKLKTMSTVCSCAMCSPSKEIVKGEVKHKQKLIQEEINYYIEQKEI